MSKELILPHVHLNGTGRQTLIDDRDAAWWKVNEAFEALKACAPNMRDFYPLENGTEIWQAAEDQHRRRLAVLSDLMNELEAELERLQETGQ
jgi:hypothetical protein